MSDNIWWLRRARPAGFDVDLQCDRPAGVRCPRPKCQEVIVYNGNYFCRCGWAFPDIRESKIPNHPGFQEFVDELRSNGWYDAYHDEGAKEKRRVSLEQLGFDKKIIERSI